MSSIIYLIIVFIIGIVCWYLISPLLDEDFQNTKFSDLFKIDDLYLRKEEILHSLKDLEADYFAKKISEEDYQSIYQETMAEGAKTLKAIEEYENSK